MANSNAAKKRIRQNATRRLRNRYRLVSTRTGIKRLQASTDKAEAEKLLPEVVSMIDKCVKKNIYHKNKASNLKSKLTRRVNALG